MKILAVDFGLSRIGIAVSDETGSLARPLAVVKHTSIRDDAARVAALAREQNAATIIVGQSLDESGAPNVAGRSAARFSQEVAKRTSIAVVLWDESLSTLDAAQQHRSTGARRGARRRSLDDRAAAVILQSYLDRPPVDR
jgi:putative Holliday junction resolvase